MKTKEEIKGELRNLGFHKVQSAEHDMGFDLWKVDDIDEINKGYEVPEFLPSYIGIGSNGGGEMLAVEFATGKIFSIPFIPMQDSDRLEVAISLEDLIKMKK